MENQPIIILQYIQQDGSRERTKLTHHTMTEALEVARTTLHVGNGLYTRVDICTEDGTVETIQKPAEPSPLGTT